jgi:hypothetical protein
MTGSYHIVRWLSDTIFACTCRLRCSVLLDTVSHFSFVAIYFLCYHQDRCQLDSTDKSLALRHILLIDIFILLSTA